MSQPSDSNVSSEQLRQLVREVLRDVLPSMAATRAPESEQVSLRNDAEVAAFVQRLIGLLDHPAHAHAVRNGSHRFVLAKTAPSAAGATSMTTSDSLVSGALSDMTIKEGLLTEAKMNQFKGTVGRLLLNSAVVVTPGARDRARQLGITMERIKS